MKVEVQIEAASKCKVVAALLLVVNVCWAEALLSWSFTENNNEDFWNFRKSL
jgi:hypothetical protein